MNEEKKMGLIYFIEIFIYFYLNEDINSVSGSLVRSYGYVVRGRVAFVCFLLSVLPM